MRRVSGILRDGFLGLQAVRSDLPFRGCGLARFPHRILGAVKEIRGKAGVNEKKNPHSLIRTDCAYDFPPGIFFEWQDAREAGLSGLERLGNGQNCLDLADLERVHRSRHDVRAEAINVQRIDLGPV